jgi:hypothetical protein
MLISKIKYKRSLYKEKKKFNLDGLVKEWNEQNIFFNAWVNKIKKSK